MITACFPYCSSSVSAWCFILLVNNGLSASVEGSALLLKDIGVAKPPHWLTRAFSLVERDDLTVNLDQLTTLQKVAFPNLFNMNRERPDVCCSATDQVYRGPFVYLGGTVAEFAALPARSQEEDV